MYRKVWSDVFKNISEDFITEKIHKVKNFSPTSKEQFRLFELLIWRKKLFYAQNCMLNWVIFFSPWMIFYEFRSCFRYIRKKTSRIKAANETNKTTKINAVKGMKMDRKNIWWWNVFILVARFSHSHRLYRWTWNINEWSLFRENVFAFISLHITSQYTRVEWRIVGEDLSGLNYI